MAFRVLFLAHTPDAETWKHWEYSAIYRNRLHLGVNAAESAKFGYNIINRVLHVDEPVCLLAGVREYSYFWLHCW